MTFKSSDKNATESDGLSYKKQNTTGTILAGAVNLDELMDDSIDSSARSIIEQEEEDLSKKFDTNRQGSGVNEKYQPFFNAFSKHIGRLVNKQETNT